MSAWQLVQLSAPCTEPAKVWSLTCRLATLPFTSLASFGSLWQARQSLFVNPEPAAIVADVPASHWPAQKKMNKHKKDGRATRFIVSPLPARLKNTSHTQC